MLFDFWDCVFPALVFCKLICATSESNFTVLNAVAVRAFADCVRIVIVVSEGGKMIHRTLIH